LGIIKLVGGKFIIVEDGKPSFVIMDYAEFSELASEKAVNYLQNRVAGMEKLEETVNKEILHAQVQDLREEVIDPDFEGNCGVEPITVEPLPH